MQDLQHYRCRNCGTVDAAERGYWKSLPPCSGGCGATMAEVTAETAKLEAAIRGAEQAALEVMADESADRPTKALARLTIKLAHDWRASLKPHVPSYMESDN